MKNLLTLHEAVAILNNNEDEKNNTDLLTRYSFYFANS